MSVDNFTMLFKQIAKTEEGSEQNLEEIERQLDHLKRGAALSYSDLEIISDSHYWSFSKYWLWPARNQIENILETTDGLFMDLPKNEISVIERLNDIFKNISLVSILLRFARPEFYAIYSFPVLQILRIERGRNAIEEYMNYVGEMRILKESFGVKNVSEVDQIVWSIFRLRGKYINELKKKLAERLPENLTPEELIIFLSQNPLRVAREYLKRKDHITAGLWAARAFEKIVNDECRKYAKYLGEWEGDLSQMIRKLSNNIFIWNKGNNKDQLYWLKEMRNIIVHNKKKLKYDDIENVIENIGRIYEIAHKCEA